MKRTFVVASMVMAAVMVSSQAVAFAEPAAFANTATHAMSKTAKMVNFKITNNTGADMKVKAGKTEMVIAAGQTQDFTLAKGDEVVCKAKSKHYDYGQVVANVDTDLEGRNITLQ